MNNNFFQIGHSVLYHLTEEDQKSFGGNHNVGEHSAMVAPGVIVRTWGATEQSVCNIKVFPDSDVTSSWKTSVTCGTNPGQFELNNNGYLHGSRIIDKLHDAVEGLEEVKSEITKEGKKIWSEAKNFVTGSSASLSNDIQEVKADLTPTGDPSGE